MDAGLRKKLIAAGAAGTLAVAGVMVTHYEGTRYTPYRDPAGILTVCEGVTGADVVAGKRYTRAECDALRDKHVAIAEASVRRLIVGYDELNTWQQAALIDFTYNVGSNALANSTLRRKINAGDIAGGCHELARWVYATAGGRKVRLAGLVTRRGAELDMCLNWPETP